MKKRFWDVVKIIPCTVPIEMSQWRSMYGFGDRMTVFSDKGKEQKLNAIAD